MSRLNWTASATRYVIFFLLYKLKLKNILAILMTNDVLQADIVCKLSQERLSLLEEALPLAGHFSETHADLQSWLAEIEAEITSLEVPADASAEQIRKQLENAKVGIDCVSYTLFWYILLT